MANARTRDTRAGFEIYRSAGTHLSLAELNRELVRLGFRPISERTHSHYKKLIRAGSNRYIPINRFDVARASRAHRNLSSLARYGYRETDLVVNTQLAKDQFQVDIAGRVYSSGDVGATVYFVGAEAQLLHSLHPNIGDITVMTFVHTSISVINTILDVDRQKSRIILEVEYNSLVSLAEVVGDESLSPSLTQFILLTDIDRINTIDIVGQRIHNFFDLIEGIRALLNEAGQFSEDNYYVAPPVLTKLTSASPTTLVIQIPSEFVEMVHLFLSYWPLYLTSTGALLYLSAKARKVFHEGTSVKLDNQFRDGLDKSKGHPNQRNTIPTRQQVDDMSNEIIGRIRLALPGTELSDEKLRALVENDILPPLRQLRDAGVTDILISFVPNGDMEQC